MPSWSNDIDGFQVSRQENWRVSGLTADHANRGVVTSPLHRHDLPREAHMAIKRARERALCPSWPSAGERRTVSPIEVTHASNSKY
jgi:hypothetical protein